MKEIFQFKFRPTLIQGKVLHDWQIDEKLNLLRTYISKWLILNKMYGVIEYQSYYYDNSSKEVIVSYSVKDLDRGLIFKLTYSTELQEYIRENFERND